MTLATMSGAFDARVAAAAEVAPASPTASGAFDAGVAAAKAPEITSGAFDARGVREDAKVVQAALWPSSSQWRRWHAAPQYEASLQRAHFFAALAQHTVQICGGAAPRDSSSDATGKWLWCSAIHVGVTVMPEERALPLIAAPLSRSRDTTSPCPH